MKLSDYKQHLETAIMQQKELANQINDLNNTIAAKKEEFIKLQGIVEYLQGIDSAEKDKTPETIDVE